MRKRLTKKSLKKKFSQALSLLLTTAMAVSAGQGITFAKAGQAPEYLPTARLSQDKLPEGECLYFGTASATVNEQGLYALRIYREGSLDKKASVEVHTLDMTALYGEDYELEMENVEVQEKDKDKEEETLLKKYVDGKEIVREEELSKTALNGGVNEEKLIKTPEEYLAATQTIGKKESSEDTEEAKTKITKTAAGTSSLAAKKEAQTGNKTRELTETEQNGQGIVQAFAEQIAGDAMNQLEYSASCKVTFAPGEGEKTVKFRILEDEESEGTESFSLLLTNPKKAELYQVVSSAISIKDDEKKVRSEISFTKPEYTAKDGKATLTVKRTGAEYSVCDMTLRSVEDTAKAGTNYVEQNEVISFAPYETKKQIELDVSGEGQFDVKLLDMKACKAGKYARATVKLTKEEDAAKEKKNAAIVAEKRILKGSGSDQTLGIEINGRSYNVHYTEGAATGKIMDEHYDPPVEVGIYYFSKPDNFSYGHYWGDDPDWHGWRKSEYIEEDASDLDPPYGKIEYYSSWIGHKGGAYCESSNNAQIQGAFFQYFINDWRSKDDFGGGQRLRLMIRAKNGKEAWSIEGGEWGRTQNRSPVKFVPINGSDSTVAANNDIKLEIAAYDEDKGKTPKSEILYYGTCAMYRKYNVSTTNPNNMRFRTGPKDSYIDTVAMQTKLTCGAQVLYENDSRDIYTTMTKEDSNLVFDLNDTNINGHTGKFGHITGYTITLEPDSDSNHRVTLEYPQDYVQFLNDNRGQNKYNGDWSNKAIDDQINKINKNLDTIPYDVYFNVWIGCMQKAVISDSHGWKQKLKFKPKVAYNDVSVEVLKPLGNAKGHFADPDLKEGAKVTYHAGDSIRLDVLADSNEYRAVGYEYSTDGGITFNTIRDGSDLFLESFKSYLIRPALAENTNRIKIDFANDTAREAFEIQGLIPQSELKGTIFEGENIINLNPEEKTIQDKMEPVQGKDYLIRIAVKNQPDDKIYRPTVTKKSGGKTYTTMMFPVIAANEVEDNTLVVGCSQIKTSEVNTYQLSGNLMTEIAPVRATGLETTRVPVTNYTVTAGTGKQTTNDSGQYLIETASSLTGSDGRFSISNISGKSGDVVPMLASNGITNGQIIEVTLTDTSKESDSYQVQADNTVISYPYGAPEVKEIYYKYDKQTNNDKVDLTKNNVKIYDDNLTLTAKVEPHGKKVKEAIFTVYTVTGQQTTYRATEELDNKNTFLVKIPKMTDSLHNGDRINVRLVDDEECTISSGQTILDDNGDIIEANTMPIEYPDRDTGLVFSTENMLLAPQSYDLEKSQSIDVPLLGNATANAGSGLISFGKTEWPGGDGYTIQVGVDALYSRIIKPDTKQKVDNFNNYISNAKTVKKNNEIANNVTEENAETMLVEMYNGDEDKAKSVFNDLKKEKATMSDVVDTIKQDASSKAKEAKASMNKDAMWSIDVALVIAFNFVLDPVKDEYIFGCGAVTVGGTFTFNKSMYTVVYGAPFFVNFNATLQGNGVIYYPTPKGEDAITAGDFEGISGNIAEQLQEVDGYIDIVFVGKAQLGVGVCGVLSARGYVSIKLQFRTGSTMSSPVGGVIGASGGVGADLLLFSFDLDVGNITLGYGSMKGQTSVSMFGGLLSIYEKSARNYMQKKAEAKKNEEVIADYGKDGKLVKRDFYAGTADMSRFGKASARKKAKSDQVSTTILLDNAAERTKPRLVQLAGNRKMCVFIGNRGDKGELNSMALFYSIYDGKQWSVPKMVDDDGTADTSPDVRKVGNKVIIAWADAGRKFTEKDGSAAKLSTMGISVASYDIESGAFDKKVKLIHDDNYFNFSPQINVVGTKIYISYMKRDLKGLEDKQEKLLDFTVSYSTMAFITYDYAADKKSEEKFVEIDHETLTDPLVMDYRSIATAVGGENYMLSAYTIDEDKNLNTSDDRELYLGIYNIDKQREYFPIRISNDSICQANPELTEIDGIVYLTWLDKGYIFQMLDVSKMMNVLFNPEYAKRTLSDESGDGQREVAVKQELYTEGYMKENDKNPNWYKHTAKELGLSEEDYEYSIYENLALGRLDTASANFSQREDMNTSIATYKLVSNGKDMYVFFTDFGKDEKSTGVEIYGVRYKQFDDSASDSGDKNSGDDWRFGKAVQITNGGMVIDELDLYMTEDNKISAVSNYFEQWIDAQGHIQYGINQLVETEFTTANSLEVKDDMINLPGTLVGGRTDALSFDVVNEGLLTSTGFDYTVSEIKGNVETEIAKGHVNTELEAGEREEVSVAWKIPEDISGRKIRVAVTETGVDHSGTDTTEAAVPYGPDLRFYDTQVLFKGTSPYVETTITNYGNAASKAGSCGLYQVDKDSKEAKEYGKQDIPALASGESKTVKIPFEPAVRDFNSVGYIDLRVKLMAGDETATTNTMLVSSTPICAQINDGAERLKLKNGESTKLKVEAAPWKEIAGKVTFCSSDAGVAAVDKNGNVTATGEGNAVISAYYPASGVITSIDVSVEKGSSTAKPADTRITSLTLNKHNQPVIKWKKVSVTSYELYRSTKKDSGFKKITTAKASVTSYTDKKAKAGKKYYYMLRTYNKKGSDISYSSYSGKKSIKLLNLTAPVVSVKKGKTSGGSYQVKVTYKKYTGTNAVIYRKKNNGEYVKIKLKNSKLKKNKSFIIKGNKVGKTYYYRAGTTMKKDGKTYYSPKSKAVKVKKK